MSNDRTKTSNNVEKFFFLASAADFKKISGCPIAYWVSHNLRKTFLNMPPIKDFATVAVGLQTGDNAKFIRRWHEVSLTNVDFQIESRAIAKLNGKKWFPYNKGGDFRKWYGNQEYVVNWKNDGEEIRNFIDDKGKQRSRPQNTECYFRLSVSWSFISSSYFGVRYYPKGFIFDVAGSSAIPNGKVSHEEMVAFLCSSVALKIMGAMNPTLNFQAGNIEQLPFFEVGAAEIGSKCIELAKIDWNNYETSWDFTVNPLIRQNQTTFNAAFEHWQAQNRTAIKNMKQLEEENNSLFINSYGLQDELSPDVPEELITLGRSDREKDCQSFISYAVGCMFGRYALDKPGLILANQGETIADYLKQIPEPVFSADDDNVIPMLDGDWFTDDVTERFGQFLKVTFGDAHYEENLKFIEQALGKDIRKYFLKDFYTDHLKRYKKRPIYWLFSSPKGTFNALIYMHRYRPDTVSVVLNDYLREFRTKLSAHKNHLEAVSISSNASAGDKTKALKDIENHRKMIDELDIYEREVLYPLATEQIEIDLDDGVKVNYQKFGEALKKIPGLAAKED